MLTEDVNNKIVYLIPFTKLGHDPGIKPDATCVERSRFTSFHKTSIDSDPLPVPDTFTYPKDASFTNL